MLHNLNNGFQSAIAPRVGAVVDDVLTLLHQELSLLRSEIREEVLEARKAVMMLILAAGCGIVAVFLFSMGIVITLATFLPDVPLWGWYLISGGILSGCAYLCLRKGRAAATDVNVIPEQTVERVKESLAWKSVDA